MDQKKTGALIRVLRLEKGLTQQGLAELLGVSNRAVSKWERGLGSPDLSLLPALSLQLGVDLAGLLSGGLPEPDNTGGSMKHIRFFVCPQCGDLITATGEAAVSCCGRRLEPLPVQKPDEAHSLQIHPVEDEWFITSGHYILLFDYDDTGFCVKDPNRVSNSSRTWDYDTLSPQIKNLWTISPTGF